MTNQTKEQFEKEILSTLVVEFYTPNELAEKELLYKKPKSHTIYQMLRDGRLNSKSTGSSKRAIYEIFPEHIKKYNEDVKNGTLPARKPIVLRQPKRNVVPKL